MTIPILNFIHSPVSSSFLVQNIQDFYFKYFNLHSSLRVTNQVSHTYVRTGKIRAVCIQMLQLMTGDTEFGAEW